MSNRDKMKDHAIEQLSDQVMALTAKMQEFERRQQPYQHLRVFSIQIILLLGIASLCIVSM
jgi:hypothetical protein